LIISPHANYLAILTTHTVHIAILPESSHLTAPDTGPMRLKTYTLGPTTHVTSQSAIASALWHPLGVNGTCLVTVTEDAVVRVWELSTTDRWSFDRPTLAIDLKKLADGTSVDQDFGASVSGASKGFSPDSFEMEVASACFAGRGSGGWSPMTLWIAMREGDVYALCPLLPEKWSPPPTLIPSLSVSIVAKVAAMEDDPEISPKSKLLAQQQLAWMSDLDIQEPMHIEAPLGEPPAEIYTRPAKPGRVPKLQGPFDFELAPAESEDELDSLLTDIYVIGPKIDADELMFGEEDELEMDDVDQEGLSIGVACLLTSSGRLSICLDLDGIEAQWLPKTKSKVLRYVEESDPPSLLTFQVLDTSRHGEVWEGNWPTFSHDVNSRYSFYITDTNSVTFISLSAWVFRLETELNEGTAGTDFRIDLLVKGQSSIRERIYTQKSEDRSTPLAASALIQDPDLGYLLLTATPYGPITIVFDTPDYEFDLTRRSRSPTYDAEPEKPLILIEPRPVYQPAHALEERSTLPSFLEKLQHSKYKRLLKEDVRLSPATLTIMTDAHKVLSEETHRLGTAAAEVFRRCERLQIELRAQIKKANDVAARVDAVTGDDFDDRPPMGINEIMEKRIQDAAKRQTELTERLEKIRKKASKGTSRELSDKERAWVDEVNVVQSKVLGEGEESPPNRRAKEPWARYEEVQQLKDELLEQVKELEAEEETSSSQGVKVPSEIRKAKVAQIITLLDRESALVEGAKSRLERLSLSS
jgi:nucleoporin NUP82